jgi:antitoxin VapB
MSTGKIFKNGGSQAVRLPKEFQLPGVEVHVRKFGEGILLIPKDKLRDMWAQSLGTASADFMRERDQGAAEEREHL